MCAACEDWTIARAYEDFAVPGGRVIQRFGVQAPHEDSRRGLIESVVAETRDRVSLFQADVRAWESTFTSRGFSSSRSPRAKPTSFTSV